MKKTKTLYFYYFKIKKTKPSYTKPIIVNVTEISKNIRNGFIFSRPKLLNDIILIVSDTKLQENLLVIGSFGQFRKTILQFYRKEEFILNTKEYRPTKLFSTHIIGNGLTNFEKITITTIQIFDELYAKEK